MKEKLNQICYGVKLEKLESHEFQQNYQQAMDGLDYSGGFYAFLVCCRDLAVNSLRAMIAVGFFLELILRAESLSGRVFVVLLAIGIGLGACIRTVNNKQSFQAAHSFIRSWFHIIISCNTFFTSSVRIRRSERMSAPIN